MGRERNSKAVDGREWLERVYDALLLKLPDTRNVAWETAKWDAMQTVVRLCGEVKRG